MFKSRAFHHLLRYPRTLAIRLWQWTGLEDKKLWDLLQLLGVPLVLAYATTTLQDSAKVRDTEAAVDKARQDSLVNYHEELSDLMSKGLVHSNPSDYKLIIAKAKTILVLQSLDAPRQHLVIQFLASSGLNSDSPKGILYAANLTQADLQSSNLSEAVLSLANFSGSDLSRSILSRANLANAIFLNKANLSHAKPDQAILTEATFVDANLTSTDFSGADLRKASFAKSNLKNSILRGSSLTGAYLEGADLESADLRGANLREANLSGANLSGADLSGADLTNAVLSGASFLDTTCPNGMKTDTGCQVAKK
jgi:uncharacterized protein YjbI with pentapeptide repeats